MSLLRKHLPVAVAVCWLLVLASTLTAAPSYGHLRGLVLDSAGQPLSNVLVSLLRNSVAEGLPTLAKTNDEGRVHLRDLDIGTYQILVKSAQYRSPVGRLVEIFPNRTAVVTLILQQLFDVGEANQANLSLKTILRTPPNERLIFRNLPEFERDFPSSEGKRSLFEEAVFQVYTNAGPNGDYLVFPSDSWGGTTTNFAVVDSLNAATDHIFAGQLNSGQDSIWRLNNLVTHRWNESHSLQLFVGFGRTSFDQPSLAALDNPNVLENERDYATAAGIARLFSVGVTDVYQVAPGLELTWGAEVDQISADSTEAFVSPVAELEYTPEEATFVRLTMASKRSTLANTLTLPDGRQINLAGPLFIARVGDQTDFGTSRYHQGSVTRAIGANSEIEVAVFDNQVFGGAVPVLAVLEYGDSPELLEMNSERMRTRGVRMTARQKVLENLNAEFSYIRGTAVGLAATAGEGVVYQLYFDKLLRREGYHAFATQLELYVPASKTHITGLIKLVPVGRPLTNVDSLADIYETGNQGVNLFVRQVIPVPGGVLNLFGVDFPTPERIEALLDVRNITDKNLAVLETPTGSVALVQNPRSFRGGIALRF